MKLKAEMGHYSSVVGNSVHLIGEDGRFLGQIEFMCQDDRLRDKDVQTRLSRIICDAVNGLPAPAVLDDVAVEILTRTAARADAAEDENRSLRASLQRCLGFLDNMEREIGMTLEIADEALAALTQPTGD